MDFTNFPCVVYTYVWGQKYGTKNIFRFLIYIQICLSNNQCERSDDKLDIIKIFISKTNFCSLAIDFYQHPNLICNVIQDIRYVFSLHPNHTSVNEIMIRKVEKDMRVYPNHIKQKPTTASIFPLHIFLYVISLFI